MGKIKALMETLLGKAGGVASLDENGKLTEAQRPSVEEVPGLTEALNQKLPRDGSEPMTGNLTVKSGSYPKVHVQTENGGESGYIEGQVGSVNLSSANVANDCSNYRAINVRNSNGDANIATALRFLSRVDSVASTYYILHTGNKPSGSYTGNSAARTLPVGGLGRALLIFSGYGIGIITATGGEFIGPNGTQFFDNSVVRYGYTTNDGTFDILNDVANSFFNLNGQLYNYQVV